MPDRLWLRLVALTAAGLVAGLILLVMVVLAVLGLVLGRVPPARSSTAVTGSEPTALEEEAMFI